MKVLISGEECNIITKNCEHCGKKMERKQYKSCLQPMSNFKKQRFCSWKCAGLASRKEAPIKMWVHCGVLIEKRCGSGLSIARFAPHKYCSLECAWLAKRKEHPSRTALIARARKYRKDACEECGGTFRLAIHHIDSDEHNNDPQNLRTLCCSCHIKTHAKTDSNWETHYCIICGEPVHGKNYCAKHYKRNRKHGSPLISMNTRGVLKCVED